MADLLAQGSHLGDMALGGALHVGPMTCLELCDLFGVLGADPGELSLTSGPNLIELTAKPLDGFVHSLYGSAGTCDDDALLGDPGSGDLQEEVQERCPKDRSDDADDQGSCGGVHPPITGGPGDGREDTHLSSFPSLPTRKVMVRSIPLMRAMQARENPRRIPVVTMESGQAARAMMIA